MADLRTYIFIDSLQPQFASFLATVARGYLPVEGQAALFVEISPGIAINQVTDVALKSTHVRPGMQIVERLYGMLEIHSDSQADVRQAGAAILKDLDLRKTAHQAQGLFVQVIRNVDDHQTMLINRMRHGNLITRGQSLYIMEVAPAAMPRSPRTKPRRRPTSTSWKSSRSGRSAASGWAAKSATSTSPSAPRKPRSRPSPAARTAPGPSTEFKKKNNNKRYENGRCIGND
jgi:hypothetical protein